MGNKATMTEDNVMNVLDKFNRGFLTLADLYKNLLKITSKKAVILKRLSNVCKNTRLQNVQHLVF